LLRQRKSNQKEGDPGLPPLRGSLDQPQASGAAQLDLAGRIPRAPLRDSNSARLNLRFLAADRGSAQGKKLKPKIVNPYGGQQVAHHTEVDRQNNSTPVHLGLLASQEFPFMSEIVKSELREAFRALSNDAEKYFAAAASTIPEEEPRPYLLSHDFDSANKYWDKLPDELQTIVSSLIGRLLPLCAELADRVRSSPLTGSEDLQEVKVATKAMRAALRLRQYNYRELDVIHDEGTVLGIRPAEQSENRGLSPMAAEDEFFDHLSILGAVLKLVEATTLASPESTPSAATEPLKYRTGTAFIMMWMDTRHPELTDVADAVRLVFRSFGVRAIRADDIEHEGLITERVLNEIRTSEFLFADLTGMRPNVYYEIGYAHALGKRVILFRKSGTGLHFDLAGYNCPEYENLRDLREKLTKRLVSLTNRNPDESTGI
jgi:hypothetical protein